MPAPRLPAVKFRLHAALDAVSAGERAGDDDVWERFHGDNWSVQLASAGGKAPHSTGTIARSSSTPASAGERVASPPMPRMEVMELWASSMYARPKRLRVGLAADAEVTGSAAYGLDGRDN